MSCTCRGETPEECAVAQRLTTIACYCHCHTTPKGGEPIPDPAAPATLFDLERPTANGRVSKRTLRDRVAAAKRIAQMHGVYGLGPDGAKCGECVQLETRAFAGRYFKCTLYGVTASEASDWRKSWAACGRFESRGVHAITVKRRRPT